MEETSHFENLRKNQSKILKMFLKNVMACFQDRDALQSLANMVTKFMLKKN
jgi:hypothetical protein